MTPKNCNKYVKRWKTVKRQIEKALLGAMVLENWTQGSTEPQNQHFKNLQRCYLLAFYMATFADWLQGPYVYKLYSDYGYTDDSIALLYSVGFASSCVFGTVVGSLADRYGRKLLCSAFGILYSLCCLSKTSSNYVVLMGGRILGGISTSILFTTFEAWYLNEHLNFFKMPPEWLNLTFTKATFYNGLSAILAGVVSQVLAETFDLGPVAPFLLAIPFLLFSLLVIRTTWKEHVALPQQQQATRVAAAAQQSLLRKFFSPLSLLKEDGYLLLYLGSVQSLFEAVMYAFIFSWTPVLSELSPPLGLVFSLFMVSLMSGSKLYAFLVSRLRYQPHDLLTLSASLASFSVLVVAVSLVSIAHHGGVVTQPSDSYRLVLCLLAFLLYEFSVGLYYPAIGYLRGRVVPEESRATLANWFRVPMNSLTCLSLAFSSSSSSLRLSAPTKFQFLYAFCSALLFAAVALSVIFSKKYVRKVLQDELAEMRTGKVQVGGEMV